MSGPKPWQPRPSGGMFDSNITVMLETARVKDSALWSAILDLEMAQLKAAREDTWGVKILKLNDDLKERGSLFSLWTL